MYRETKELAAPRVTKHHLCLEAWRKRIDEAEARGGFTSQEQKMALDWDLCAIGESRQRGVVFAITRDHAPMDKPLQTFGAAFYWEGVRENGFHRCRLLVTCIENYLAQHPGSQF